MPVPPYAAFDPDAGSRPAAVPQIRRATPDDAGPVSVIDREREGGDPADVVEQIRRSLGRDVPKVWVATVEGEIAAFAKVRWVDPAAPDGPADTRGVATGHYLMGVVVARAQRRRGIGRALTRFRLDWIAAQGATEAFYLVNTRNRASIALHRAFGFEEVAHDVIWPELPSRGGVSMLLRAPVVATDDG